jgi:biopolymer transport protein ExbB/biopolymer transport protein TolQ
MLIEKLLLIAEVSGQAVLYLLLALSVLSIGIILERWVYFRRRRVDAAKLKAELGTSLRAGKIDEAKALLEKTPGLEADCLREALSWYADGPAAVEQILVGRVREKRKAYESGLLFLGTLGNNAPFIGLFGTVLGIVTAFRALGTQAGTSGDMGSVMTAIAEALVATAVGILVALPAVIAFNVFQQRAAELEENVAAVGSVLLAHMRSEKGQEGRA